jgi:peptide/nickel transport system substrate-binding protein
MHEMTRAHRRHGAPQSAASGRTARRRRAWMTIACLVAIAMVTAGCSSSSSSSQTTSSTNASATPSVSSKTLYLQFVGPPQSLSPGDGTNLTSSFFYSLDYDPLIYDQPNGTFAPDLATSWSYVGAGNSAFRLTLRSGVHFTDGTPLTAQAVKNSLEYVKGTGQGQSSLLVNLASIDVTGPMTLVLHFSAPTPDLPFLLSQDEVVGDIIGPQGLAHPASLDTSSDGAGAYKLDFSKSVTGSQYTYVPNPAYWDPKAIHFAAVVIKIITAPTSVVAAMQTNQVQYGIVDPRTAAGLSGSNIRQVSIPATWWALDLADRNGQVSKPLADVRVRQALNYAINRAAIATALYGKYGQALDEIAVPGTNAYVPSDANYYTYNPTKAKQLLAAAGYPNGFTLSALDWSLLDPNNEVAQAVASQLAAVGVKVTITNVTNPTQFGTDALSKKFPAIFFPPLSEDMDEAAIQLFTPSTSLDPFGTKDTQLSTLLNSAATSQPGPAASLYQQVQTLVQQAGWFVPVSIDPSISLFSPDLVNATVTSANPDVDPVNPTSPTAGWYFSS